MCTRSRLRAFLPALLALGLALEAPAQRVEIGLNFTGARFQDSGSIPPDSMMAVGEDHIVEFVNGNYSVFRKADGVRLQSISDFEFWVNAGILSFDTFDPRILYDAASRRWFALMATNRRSAASGYAVAVSRSADPSDGWRAFEIDGDSRDRLWVDFPMLGLNARGVFVTANMFTNDDDAIAGGSVLVLPKDDLLADPPSAGDATLFEVLPTGEVGFRAQPVVDLDGSDGPGIILSDLSILGFLIRTDVEGDVRSPTLLARQLIPTDPFAFPPPAPQPGPKQDLETVEAFTSSPVRRNGTVWGVSTVDAGGRPALRWLQLDAATNQILQSGLIADEEQAYYYGSIAVNEFGDVVIGFSGSSESRFVSSYAVVGETTAGVTRFGDPILLRAGAADYEVTFGTGRNRWGDYSATVVDPEDPNTFWTVQEFVEAEDSWATQITQIRLIRTIAIGVDVRPGSDENPFNPASGGLVPVALLGSGTLDVDDVDRASLAFGPAGAAPVHEAGGHPEDVNGDGVSDLVSHYASGETGIAAGETQACVTGELLDGTAFEGCDTIRIIVRPRPK